MWSGTVGFASFSPLKQVPHPVPKYRDEEQAPKTPAAVRTIDIAAPLAVVLAAYAEGKTGLLFATRSGRPLSQRNVHRAAGHALHAFRRFRTEVLQP